MYSLFLVLLGLGCLALTFWTWRQWRATRSGLILLVLLPLAALPYELLVVGLGRWIGEGRTLLELSGLPILWWTLILPLALISFAGQSRRWNFAWAKPDWSHGAFCIGAVLLILWKLPHILTVKQLHPACWRDTVRYVPSVIREEACAAGQAGINLPVDFPVVWCLVFGAFAAAGAGLWRESRWQWLAVAMLAALVLLLVPPDVTGPLPAYFGKAIGLTGITLAAIRNSHLT